MTDHFTAAVEAWNDRTRNDKLFAEHCAQVSGARTAELATACKLDEDTITLYRNAYRLCYTLSTHIESETIRTIWDGLNISIWFAASKPRICAAYTLQELHDFLFEALEHNWTVKQFRVLLDNEKNPRPEWIRRFERLSKGFAKLATDYKGVDMPEAVKTRLERLAEYVANELQAIAAMGEAPQDVFEAE